MMSQRIIGQKEKRDMRIYVDHISYMRALKQTVTTDKDDGDEEDSKG